ncbi:MAG TPA: hypothetical protein VJC08_02475 [bacterium]|nr:hypothetical protein [bacterium]
MFCNFCGKNFDSSEGFEEATRSGHHYIRCEKCVYHQAEEQYDWRAQMYGRGRRMQASQGRGKPAAGPARKGNP